MNRFRAPRLAWALLAALAACDAPGRPPPEIWTQIVPQIVNFAERDARANAYGGAARGPLIVNVESFRGNGYRLTHHRFAPGEIERAIGRPVLNLEDTAAVVCEQTEPAPGCWIKDYGVLLRLNIVHHAPERIRAFVTSTVTDQRYIPPVLCDRGWELVFRKSEAGRWGLADSTLTRNCASP